MSGHSSVWGKSRDPKLDNELPPDQVDASEAWKSFGRGTDAGKLLYSLYGGKNQTQFTPNVTIKTKPHVDPFEEDRAKKLARAQEIKARKQSVELPDPTPQRRIDPEMLLNYRLRGAHRRQQDTIQDDARQELEQLRLNRRPYMPGTTREETIDTAQKMMEYRGKLPVEPPQPAYVPMRAREPQDEFRARIGEIVDEIEEREQFLEEMRELGQGKQYEARIRGEIGEFLRELRQLEKLLGEDKLSNRYNMIASKAAAAATTGAGALIAPPSGNSAPSPMNAAARMKQARNKVHAFDADQTIAAAERPNDFDLVSGKAFKDLQVAFAAAAAYGGVSMQESQPPARSQSKVSGSQTKSTAYPTNYVPPRF